MRFFPSLHSIPLPQAEMTSSVAYSRTTSVFIPISLKSITILYSNRRQHYSSDSFSGDEAGDFLFEVIMTLIDQATSWFIPSARRYVNTAFLTLATSVLWIFLNNLNFQPISYDSLSTDNSELPRWYTCCHSSGRRRVRIRTCITVSRTGSSRRRSHRCLCQLST